VKQSHASAKGKSNQSILVARLQPRPKFISIVLTKQNRPSQGVNIEPHFLAHPPTANTMNQTQRKGECFT